MTERYSYETHNIYSNLSDQQQFKLNKINEIKYYFVTVIKERELMNKRLSNYIASFDYFAKSLIAWFVTTGRISVASFTSVIGAPVGIVINLAFSISFRNLICIFNVKSNKK